MPLGNPIRKQNESRILSVLATEGQTVFTVQGGYIINHLSVFRNGVRLSNSEDFTAGDGSTVTLNNAANIEDRIEFHVFDRFTVQNAIVGAASTQTINGDLVLNGKLFGQLDVPSINLTGIITATELDLNGKGDISSDLNVVGVTTVGKQVHVGTGVSIAAGGLNVTAGITTVQALQATTGIITGTAAQLELVGNEGVSAALRLTADQGDDNGDGWEIRSNQDDNDLTISNNTTGSYVDKFTLLKTGELTLTSDLTIPDKIVHNGDTDTAIRFPGADIVSVETGGSERLRVDSAGLKITDKLIHTGDTDTFLEFGTNQILLETGGSERFRVQDDKVMVSVDFKPDTDSARDLGTNSNRFANGYFDTLYGNGSNLTSLPTQITFSNPSNNRILTSEGGVGVNAEANLTFDGTQLQIGGDSTVSGTFGLEIYNTDSNEGTALIAGDAGARLDIMDTGSSERLRIAAAGAIYFISYKSGDDIIFQATTGSGTAEKLRITSSGSLLLGTTVANERAHIHTASSAKAQIQITNTTTGTSASDGFTFGITSGEEVVFANQENTDMYFSTNNAERLRILSNGRVGINTASTNRQVTIKDDAGGGVGIIGNNAGIYMGTHGTGGFQSNAAIARAAAANYHISGSAIGDLCVSAESTKDIIIGHSVNAGAMAEAMRVHHDGFITNSNNPAFHAYGLLNNATGAKTDDTNVDAVFGTIRGNKGSDYSNSNGRFTAPVAGYYFFGMSLLIDDGAGTGSNYICTFFKNGSFYARAGYDRRGSDRSGYYGPMFSNTCVAYLDVGDYMTVRMDTSGFHTGSEANFCGFLIG